ncbi:hypothetical protein AQ490_21900 [Wenjunlia vitaminophila]|uniref:Uncharacterized protein n=1 Tax=Wenjunlia vitaminophila TaxID=76728 RepID=A0A0T6LSU6_WENVI|nr:GTPase-associated protein 1-related protein [Wenjunlia vitaminophila]KRV48977.1 hypothetical protein AQ490_21900 [Wenjunlia vitaminophila]
MLIRRLSYVLGQEPATGVTRLLPVLEGAEGTAAPDELSERVERLVLLTHREPRVGADLPVGTLSFSRFPDGSGLLCNVRAGGAPGSEGACRVEAVHLAPGSAELERLWPIDTWHSPSWEAAAGSGGAGDALLPGARFTQELLVRFVGERSARVAPFLADVRRLFEDPAGRQVVVAERDPETVALWIALACASLPDEHARALTFVIRTTSPARAPQQVVGIGPEADFDRSDPVVLEHLYRVHDGLGGPGSPARTDPWSELTAWLWLAGVQPRSHAGTRPSADPFALAPLVAAALRTGALLETDPAPLTDDTVRAMVPVLAASAGQPGLVPGDDDHLVRVCRRLGRGRAPDVVEPLALAVARAWLGAVLDGTVPPEPDVTGELPLGAGARRALREDFGLRLEEDLRRRLRGPVSDWAGPLRLAFTLGSGTGRVVEDAVEGLVRALLSSPEEGASAEAAAVLEHVAHPELTGRVLGRLGAEATGWRLGNLRALAASPQGHWLLRDADDAPLVLRLTWAAAGYGGPPHGLGGGELWEKLSETLPGGTVPDADTLVAMWRLVWDNGRPANADVPAVVRVGTPRLIVEAKLANRLLPWLVAPEQVSPELVGFARAVLHGALLGSRERATAQLLVLCADTMSGTVPLAAAVERVGVLRALAEPLSEPLWRGVAARLAVGLARAEPSEVSQLRVVRFLATADRALLREYRSAVLSHYLQGATTGALAQCPRDVARLFYAWSLRMDGATDTWQQVTLELRRDVLGAALGRMGDQELREVPAHLPRTDEKWQQAWQQWLRDT